MTSKYEFSWGEDTEYKKLTLKCFDTEIKFDLISDDEKQIKEKIVNVVLYAEGVLKLNISDIIDKNPDVIEIEKVDVIKSNIKELFRMVVPKEDLDDKFRDANKYYLSKYNEQGDSEAKKFKNLTKLRHSLRKYLVMAHIRVVISTEVTCRYKTKQDSLVDEKDKKIALLKALLKDSTNLLLNIDALPSFDPKLVKEESDDFGGIPDTVVKALNAELKK